MSFALIDQMMIDEGAKNSQRGGEVHYYGGLDHFDQFLGGTDCV